MSELRWDPLERTWALIASERGRRPQDFMPNERRLKRDEPCPFCLLLEGHGPAVRIAQRKTTSDAVFVVANRFPVLSVEAQTDRRQVGPYDLVNGVGAHEVVIETRSHDRRFRHLPPEQLAAILLTWKERVADLQRDRRLQHVEVFKNDGPAAGATLEHAHSQIVGTPVRPPRLSRQLEAALRHWRDKERCLVCDIVAFEIAQKVRVVDQERGFVAWCPYASRNPFEVQISPHQHQAHFTSLDDAQARALAELLSRILRALDSALLGADLNLCLSLSPSTQSFTKGREGLELIEEFWHWRIELIPRLLPFGGFELGTDLAINPTPPEDAAGHLRKLL